MKFFYVRSKFTLISKLKIIYNFQKKYSYLFLFFEQNRYLFIIYMNRMRAGVYSLQLYKYQYIIVKKIDRFFNLVHPLIQ
jgi:hypothetical protein